MLRLQAGQLREMLRPLGLADEIAGFEPVAGGRCNSNYCVGLKRGERKLFVRIYSRGADVARKEAALGQLLAGRAPVAAVLHSAPDGVPGCPPFAVQEWVQHPSLSAVLESLAGLEARALGESVGETLGRIVGVRFSGPGDLGPDLSVKPWPWADDGDGMFLEFVRGCLEAGRAVERLGNERSQRLWELARCEAFRLREPEPAACLVHGDFGPTNLLVSRDRGRPSVAAVVDWEFAHSGTPLMDLANLLRREEQAPPEFASGVAAAFSATWGPLPADWRARAKLIDLTAQLEFLQSVAERGEIHAQAIEIIDRTLASWDSYLPS
ncbi:MAG: phosphotransferase [Candidatus Wallbacteria bacterium]|nr:phosphotransferase [Candidatus Wallbacteria bacterium]